MFNSVFGRRLLYWSRPAVHLPIARTSLNIILCRYENGKLIKRILPLSETEYVAVSHVWGKAEWRDIQGIEGKVLASEEKAYFIEKRMPDIIGNQYFWMDILCIDQHDKDAWVAVTQHIPVIFRSATLPGLKCVKNVPQMCKNNHCLENVSRMCTKCVDSEEDI